MNQPFQNLGPKAVTVNGFYRTLLQTQADGLSGHIDEVFPDLSENSAWLGGKGESWERGPYYIDGLIPLAYLLDDAALIKKANHWVDAILNSQRADGFFGPPTNDDWWPRFVVTKAFSTYYHLTGDARILLFLTTFFDYVINHIEKRPLYFWAYARGLECSEALELVYQHTKNEKYRELGKLLIKQSIDWDWYFSHFPYPKTTTHYLSRTLFHALRPILARQAKKEQEHPEKVKPKSIEEINRFNHSSFVQNYLKTHGVNIAMALKYPVYRQYLEAQTLESAPVWNGLDQLLKYHGNALDLFSSDEHLNGPNPTQGVELCVVVEAMYSMEEILRLTGDPKAADYLEYYAYNALLATLTPDMCAHQYVQQVNQTHASVSPNRFYDADKTATTFGVAPFFGCCAANMHQGFPKLLMNAIYTKDDAIYIYLYIPGRYDIAFPDGHVVLEVKTKYPFDDSVGITVIETTVSTPKKLVVRIPYGEPCEITEGSDVHRIEKTPQLDLGILMADRSINLLFFSKIKTVINPDGTYSLRRGSLLFANPIPANEIHLHGNTPFHDRAFVPLQDFILPHPQIIMHYHHPEDAYLSGTLLTRNLEGNDIQDYVVEIACLQDEHDFFLFGEPTIGKKIVLVPYGLTRLRIAQFK